MERGHIRHHSDHFSTNPQSHHTSSTSYRPPFSPPKTSQTQMPFGDPFAHSRDPFLHRKNGSKDENGPRARAWSNSQAHQALSPPNHRLPSQDHSFLQVPPKFVVPPQRTQPSNAASNASSTSYDSQRKRSISAASPTHFVSDPSLPSFAPRAMPPPSPHQRSPSYPQNADSQASLFSGIRDLANLSSSRRPAAGMSISSMLGNDDARPTFSTAASPHSVASHPPPSRDLMHPPSPGRARSASMRESGQSGRGYLERSPPYRSTIEPRSATTHREGGFNDLFPAPATNGSIPRPSSQPDHNAQHRRDSDGTKLGMFRTFDDTRQEPKMAIGQKSQYSPVQSSFREMREDQAALFRPAYPAFDVEKNGDRQTARTPPLTHEPTSYPGSFRNGQSDRPSTLEDHQRFENARMPERKDSSGSVTRSVLNISPELSRRGRDSPLPQAVQGVARRHIGPGGDHPAGIKSEFGRMFSGLGSGVGSATPVAGQSMNGAGTPRLQSPRLDEDEYDQPRSASVSAIKKNARRRDDLDEVYDGRMTPSLSRGMKRSKTTHPPHHHHHHHHTHRHHHGVADTNGGYGMIRFPSNPQPSTQHRHVHLHNTPHVHHHHHGPRSAPLKKASVIIRNDDVLTAVAKKPRKHLGSMPYNVEVTKPSKKMIDEHQLDYVASPDLMPDFAGKENCLFTVRVPKWYISQTKQDLEAGEISRLSEICRNRRVWGTDIYTDDSDVIAAAVHAGWIIGDHGSLNTDIQELDAEGEAQSAEHDNLLLDAKPAWPVNIPARDMHVTVLILPTLQSYAGSHRHHIMSRDWTKAPHDGMSFMIHKIEFVEEGGSDRGFAREAKSRKARIAREEDDRRQAAADALLMLPSLNRRTVGVIVA